MKKHRLYVKNRCKALERPIFSVLPLKVRGLWAYLQSKPDGWEVSIEEMAEELFENEEDIRIVLEMLMLAHVLEIKPRFKKGGGMAPADYILY